MVCKSFSLVCYFISTFNFYVIVSTFLFNIHVYLYVQYLFIGTGCLKKLNFCPSTLNCFSFYSTFYERIMMTQLENDLKFQVDN